MDDVFGTINPHDRYVIYSNDSGRPIESWSYKVKADQACETLNQHEIANGRKPKYEVRDKKPDVNG